VFYCLLLGIFGINVHVYNKKKKKGPVDMISADCFVRHGRALPVNILLLRWSRHSASFMEPEGSLPYSQDPATGPFPE
jgi:hypothetical protein